jgi:hypothetical protein
LIKTEQSTEVLGSDAGAKAPTVATLNQLIYQLTLNTMSITTCFRCFFIVIPFFVVLNSYGQTGAGNASSKNQKASGSNSVPEEIRTILLPVSAVEPLLKAFSLNEFPMFAISAVNNGLLAVQGLPLAKLEVLLANALAQNPMSSEDYLRYVLPAPVLTGDTELDVEKYDSALKLFQLIHPEITWYQPGELVAILQTEGGARKLFEMQRQSGRAISLDTILKVPEHAPLLSTPDKAVD